MGICIKSLVFWPAKLPNLNLKLVLLNQPVCSVASHVLYLFKRVYQAIKASSKAAMASAMPPAEHVQILL